MWRGAMMWGNGAFCAALHNGLVAATYKEVFSNGY